MTAGGTKVRVLRGLCITKCYRRRGLGTVLARIAARASLDAACYCFVRERRILCSTFHIDFVFFL
jgi:hypothetical protein